ncbi:MAG TPA: secretin N-terminal domain-containing protein, partial [Azospira sp.]|nr:secretin N-terminal domain-containing protein [Azospira sp.]
NPVYRQAYRNGRQRLVARLLGEAALARAGGRPDEAEAIYRRLQALAGDQGEVAAGLAALARERRHDVLLREAEALIDGLDPGGAERRVAQVLQENPTHREARALHHWLAAKNGREQALSPALRESFRKPATLEFRDASFKQVLEALAMHSGLNFLIDRDVPADLTVTIFLRNVSVAEALELILSTHQLRQRVLGETTLLIYPDTAAKQGDHQELVVRNFFLANAEAKQVLAMLKAVLKAKNVFADDKLNLLIMRDTPAMIRLAERLVATHDVAEPEVMLEVAIVEVTRSQLSNLGIKLPSQLTLSPLPGSGTTLTLRDLQHLSSSTLGAAITPLVINLQDDADATNLLANPRIRTHNREKALIRIGDRVPVITTTATSTGFVSENVQYVDVGLKLEVEPTIFPNDEISIKLALEVSSVVKEIVSKAGTVSYQIGGRNASTVLRLRDGETQVLGGLINDDDRRNANRFPGLGRLPGIGRLFSSENDNNQKTELVLSITPRIVRPLQPPAQVPGEFWSGTENDPRLRSTLHRGGADDERRPALPALSPTLSPTLPPLPPPEELPTVVYPSLLETLPDAGNVPLAQPAGTP